MAEIIKVIYLELKKLETGERKIKWIVLSRIGKEPLFGAKQGRFEKKEVRVHCTMEKTIYSADRASKLNEKWNFFK